MNLLADANLPNLEYYFPEPFRLSFYRSYQEALELIKHNQIPLCRSTLTVSASLLKDSPIEWVATATSGIEHISKSYLKDNNIGLLDAKGANAPAVADYVIATCALIYANRYPLNIRAGIIGCGEIGSRVAERLKALGCTIFAFDPPKAILEADFQSCQLEDLYDCELICIHANWHQDAPYPSHDLISENFLNQLKPGVAIINASRGAILNEIAFLKTKTKIQYCTDVYDAEPEINPLIIEKARLCTPHIAGHSIEAKNMAIYELSKKLHGHYQLYFDSNLIKKPGFTGHLKPYGSWQEMILSLYNPQIETNLLKTAAQKEFVFLSCRKNHQNRHDFKFYDAHDLPSNFKKILGYDF